MAILFFLLTENKKPAAASGRTVIQMLRPLKSVRVWRFGLYYFLLFGGFVALAQWLVPYYVNVYSMTIVSAGLLTSVFSLPSSVIRAFGGYLSDRVGARTVMYWILGAIGICSLALFFPKMEIESPGNGIMARRSGTVSAISDTEIRVGDDIYVLRSAEASAIDETETHLLPAIRSWQVAEVEVGEHVERRALLASGVTNVFFQANVWVFTILVFVIGIAMGIGKAAVYKYIPEYFPDEVGVVGGMVGVIGGLGGFFCPIIFGYLLKGIGLWTTTWIFFFLVTMVCLAWLHITVRSISKREHHFEIQRNGP
jgi:NNP family nitrate/nitrite transporter-like MFS transporter